MAVRTPVKLDGSNNLVAMSVDDIANIKAEMIRQYGLNPSVTITVVASGGSLGTLTDTRYQAGAAFTGSANFPTEATTAEPSQLSINYSRLNEILGTASAPVDTANKAFPLYLDAANNLQAMSLTDMYDTFVNDVITSLTTADQTPSQAGTYVIHTAATLTGATLVDASPVFSDTRADLTQYTGPGIPEALDQPTTITNYYLFRIDAATAGSLPTPVFVRGDNNLQAFASATFQTLLADFVRYYATQTGSRIDYIVNTSTTGARGSGMVNTDHTGVTGAYVTNQQGPDAYRAQEFPNGTPATISTNYLRCVRA